MLEMRRFFIIIAIIPTLLLGQVNVDSLGFMTVQHNLVGGSQPEKDNHIGIYFNHLHTIDTLQYIGIKSKVYDSYMSTNIGDVYSIYGESGCTYHPAYNTTHNAKAVGVVGCGYKNGLQFKFSIGVAGIGMIYSKNIGIYGGLRTSGDAIPNTLIDYPSQGLAGYFGGPVLITGSLITNGVTATLADAALYNDIKALQSTKAAESIMQLTPIEYKYNNLDTIHYGYTKQSKEFEVKHYGLIAHEVEKKFPNLVFEAGDGNKAINYIEIIPLLLQAIKEQQAQINELYESSKMYYSKRFTSAKDNNSIDENMNTVLFQNQPNPFKEQTTIDYVLPSAYNSAYIYIYDLQGNQIKSYRLQDRGKGNIVIGGKTLKAGMYLYTLIIDNCVIDTKRMILTE